MNYIKINVAKDISGINRDFRRTVSDMFRMANPMFTLGQNAWIPPTDIFETDGEILITAELAGVRIDDIHVETDQRTLKIFGVRRDVPRHNVGRYLLAEIPSGYFERTFTLLYPIDTEAITASYSEGLLQIRLKKKPGDEVHKITILCI